jgi:hypothetical protein
MEYTCIEKFKRSRKLLLTSFDLVGIALLVERSRPFRLFRSFLREECDGRQIPSYAGYDSLPDIIVDARV